MNEERVLVIPTADFEAIGLFHGFCDDVDRYVAALLHGPSLRYLPRSLAEDDPTHKQLIPYAILKHGDGIFSYARGKAGGESRLHAKWSIGVGGHISSTDGQPGPDAYRKGFEREIEEEVAIEGTWTDRIVGLIHDDRTPVGQVHLGIVHLVELESPIVAARDLSLTEAKLRPITELATLKDQMETWSAFCISAIFP